MKHEPDTGRRVQPVGDRTRFPRSRARGQEQARRGAQQEAGKERGPPTKKSQPTEEHPESHVCLEPGRNRHAQHHRGQEQARAPMIEAGNPGSAPQRPKTKEGVNQPDGRHGGEQGRGSPRLDPRLGHLGDEEVAVEEKNERNGDPQRGSPKHPIQASPGQGRSAEGRGQRDPAGAHEHRPQPTQQSDGQMHNHPQRTQPGETHAPVAVGEPDAEKSRQAKTPERQTQATHQGLGGIAPPQDSGVLHDEGHAHHPDSTDGKEDGPGLGLGRPPDKAPGPQHQAVVDHVAPARANRLEKARGRTQGIEGAKPRHGEKTQGQRVGQRQGQGRPGRGECEGAPFHEQDADEPERKRGRIEEGK